MFKTCAWVSVVFYALFLGVVMYFCALKYAELLFDIPKDVVINALSISDIFETLSHLATVGVFLWAIWTFREQRADKVNDDTIKRVSNNSIRLIAYISDNAFRLTPSTLDVVNSYLSVLNADLNDENVHADIKKEGFLALSVVKTFFKSVSLEEIMGYEFHGSYSEIINELTMAYSDPETIACIDNDFHRRVFDRGLRPGEFHWLSPPRSAIRLWQIEELISQLFSLSEEDACADLSQLQQFTSQNSHNGIYYPALYAYYYFYKNGNVVVGANNKVAVRVDGLKR